MQVFLNDEPEHVLSLFIPRFTPPRRPIISVNEHLVRHYPLLNHLHHAQFRLKFFI